MFQDTTSQPRREAALAKAVASVVAASPFLQDLRFSSTRGGQVGGMALAQSLGTLTTLVRLDLNDNTFGPGVGVALGAALERQRFVEVVNLGDTSRCLCCCGIVLL